MYYQFDITFLLVGLTFTEKWNTENVLNTEVKIEDQLADGLDITFDTSFAPQTGYTLTLLASLHYSKPLIQDYSPF